MGQSTDAYLFFGFDLGEDWEPPWGDEDDPETPDDWESAWAEKKGVVRPKHLWGLMEWTPEQEAEYRAWDAAKDKAIEGIDVKTGSHCSSEYPIHYVYIRQFHAWRGFPAIVDPKEMETTEEDVRKLREFCEFLGIDVGDQDPQWHLASDWG